MAAAGLLGARLGNDPAVPPGDVPATAATTPSPSTAATDALGPFRVARVNRAGTVVTVFVTSPSRCRVWEPTNSTVDEEGDRVVISIAGAPKSVECSRSIDTPVQVALSQPLGDRTLVDGRDQDIEILLFRDADLPVVPTRWWEVHGDYSGLDGSWFGIGYTTPGGPDLRFTVARGPITGPVLEQVRIGSHDAVIVDFNRQEAVRWAVGDLVYSMTLSPSEGETTSRADLHDVLAQLT
jgi:hypothetical protein